MQLTLRQQEVLDRIKEFIEGDTQVFILKGYAGTGKTTMIKEIERYISQSRQVMLMAPTGRAARVLSQKTQGEATTIHKAIYGLPDWVSKDVKDVAETEFHLTFPVISTDGKVIAIVDEASMLCSRKMEQELFQFGTDNLMEDLLTFVRPSFGGKVIFVGDPAQLPPVGESKSNALDPAYFRGKGMKVMEEELTEVLRQTDDSVILKNAMQIRDLLSRPKRNFLVFEERKDDVESLPAGELLKKYLENRQVKDANDSVVICFSNKSAANYNREIRQSLYGQQNPALRRGDVLMVVQNNYQLDCMNGEFVQVLQVGDHTTQSAPIYVQQGGSRVRKIITMHFVRIVVKVSEDEQVPCQLLLDLLENGAPSVGIDEQRALYVNFCMRNPHLKQGTEEFANALRGDEYYNSLKAKYGYAVTGHKCQGGEWDQVFVDYSGRTGLDDDCLRWAYTATTRARKSLYVANLPHITPFSRFRIDPIQQCSKIDEECKVIGNVEHSPFHKAGTPDYLHAKWMTVCQNMEWTPYQISRIESKPYLEIYYIQTPDGIERYDLFYKKGGVFMKAKPHSPSAHTALVTLMLDDERSMPLLFNYQPSDEVHGKLFSLIQSVCDGSDIQITNVVEHKEQYFVKYYFRTSGCMSYLCVYIDKAGFVTYAKPMSLAGADDDELQKLISEITNHFD